MQRCSLSALRRVFPKLKPRAYSAFAHRTGQTRQELEEIPIAVTHAHSDPFALVASELTQIRERLLSLLGSAHPDLHATAEYLFLQPSVQLRSLLILLFSRATNGLGGSWQRKIWEANCECSSGQGIRTDNALQDPSTLRDWYPTIPDHTASFSSVFELQKPTGQNETPLEAPMLSSYAAPIILPTQIRLGQIMEMVHVASLLHDGVHDGPLESPDRATNRVGVKLTILGGDFLLGRASAVLPRLGENEVVELVSGIISNIVEGEMLRMEGIKTPRSSVMQGRASLSEAWERYLEKIYFKTASLMAKGARASVVLGGCKDGDALKEAAYVYGRNIGFAKQLMDDANDYEFGFSRVRPGIATAPALYAVQEHPELLPIINRHLAQNGDIERVLDAVRTSPAVDQTRDLARRYASRARGALQLLPVSDASDALETLVERVVSGSC